MIKEDKMGQEEFYELCCYTLVHQDPSFIHQYAVDTFAAQVADEKTKSITITFALIGLYLHNEKDFTGKEVQNAHMKLAEHPKKWPTFKLPKYRGNITVSDVIKTPEGSDRDNEIKKWSANVWDAYKPCHDQIMELVKTELWNK